jgi:hypothetical protein
MIHLSDQLKSNVLKDRLFMFTLPILLVTLGIAVFLSTQTFSSQNHVTRLSTQAAELEKQKISAEKAFNELKKQDQVKRNDDLEKEIESIQKTYTQAVSDYEKLLQLKEKNAKLDKKYDELFAKSLRFLGDKNYASAGAVLNDLRNQMQKEEDKIAASFNIPANVPASNNAPASNSAPGGGYSRQKVNAGIGEYLVDIIAADLGSTRVIVDTASEGDCHDNCPVLSLGDYVTRNGAYAGINGSYFCPASYPQCAGKTNSFDTLLMNKNKKYFNSDNNVYSTVPAVIFQGGSIRFVGQSLEWGRDTGIDGMIANQPLVLSGGNVTFGGDGDPKKGSKGSRSFVGSKGNTVYIGVVHNATVAEVGHVLKALGLEYGLNLDSGGSTALWYNGYKAGPGRNIPNAILFVRK